MHCKNRRARSLATTVAILTTAALVSACGGSSSSDSSTSQSTQKNKVGWQDAETSTDRDNVFAGLDKVFGQAIVKGKNYIAVASTTERSSGPNFGTVMVYPKKGAAAPIFTHELTSPDIAGMAPLPNGGFVVAGHKGKNWFLNLFNKVNGEWRKTGGELIWPCANACNMLGGTSRDLYAVASSKNGNIYLLGYGGAALTEDTILKVAEANNGKITEVHVLFNHADTTPNGMPMDILVKSKAQKDYVYFVDADGFTGNIGAGGPNSVWAYTYQSGGANKKLWSTPTGSHTAYLRFGPKGNIYAFSADGGNVKKLDRKTGDIMWEFKYLRTNDFAGAFIDKQGNVYVAGGATTKSGSPRHNYTVVYAVNAYDCGKNKECATLDWQQLYDREPLIDLRGKVTKVLGLSVNLKATKLYSQPIALHGNGANELYLVTNSTIVYTIALPSTKVGKIIVLNATGGDVKHTNAQAGVRFDAVTFSSRKPSFVFAVGGNSQTKETNAAQAEKLVTGLYGAHQCGGGIRGFICGLGLNLF